MSNTKLNEGDASTNDSELCSFSLGCATSFGSKRRIKSVSLSSEGRKGVKVNMFNLKSMWGNFQFDFACSSARGHSRGKISMWDTGIFVKSSIQCGENFVVVDDEAQKAKVKWDIEGDENTAFFHGLLKQRRRLKMVYGIMHDGEWCTDPELVKRTFLEFYRDKFAAIKLERLVTIDEIKYAVWQCGSDKSPGPDGFSFKFVKKYWEIMKQDIYKVVMEFCQNSKLPLGLIGVQYKIIAKLLALRLAVVGSLLSSEQSAFVKGRQILDEPLMVSEVMEWYKLKRKKLMIFKVDFEKAYDSLCWEYLDYMMKQFGFGHKSRSWILECIVSARMSILVNGSPTNEIALHRGLRQRIRYYCN
ncbi:putative RNA-directed DNA polymerase, eukaryota, reverse transcriptase zinc-binding domain protein [Tanacetum coccineum]|uniref:RNA-directed DNA polymerase, eukaryota, reverse transcriptase zinc-binding domain protein n=1 Tax=Tanacetum coccineum TaxID=301880 RepID=A0ABQ5EKD2_9ASTR